MLTNVLMHVAPNTTTSVKKLGVNSKQMKLRVWLQLTTPSWHLLEIYKKKSEFDDITAGL